MTELKADVQLEHGHVRIANRLYEAMLNAEFNATQFKILHGFLRLTYGWRRKTVTVSHAELANTVHLAATGSFRAALSELIREGVVIVVSQPSGHSKTTYAIQKDFTRWKKFARHPDSLAGLYDKRPESHDELFESLDETERVPENGQSGCLETGTLPELDPKEGASIQAERVPLNGRTECLQTGTLSAPKCDTPPQLRARKDRKDRKDNTREERAKNTLSSLGPDLGASEPPTPNGVPASPLPLPSTNRRSKPLGDKPAKPAKPPRWPHFPQADCDALYEQWTETRGAVDYAQLRNAFGPLYPATGPRYELKKLRDAIEFFGELADSDSPQFAFRYTVRNFVSDIQRCVRLGAMQHVDEWGIPTERGRATKLFGEAS